MSADKKYLSDDNFDDYQYHRIEVLVSQRGRQQLFPVYTGTESTQMLFNPQFFSRDWKTNHSVVLNFKHVRGREREYRVTSVLFEDTYNFTISPLVYSGSDDQITRPVGLMSGTNPGQIFREVSQDDNTLFAYSINVGRARYYLAPVVIPQYNDSGSIIGSRQIIGAVLSNSADGYYLFRNIGVPDYPQVYT